MLAQLEGDESLDSALQCYVWELLQATSDYELMNDPTKAVPSKDLQEPQWSKRGTTDGLCVVCRSETNRET